MSTLQNISCKARKESLGVESTFSQILKLQSDIQVTENAKGLVKRVPGYVQSPSISLNGVSVSLFDEALVKLYHLLSPHDVLFFDASGSFVAPFPWLLNKDGKPMRVLLYALTVRHPAGKVPPIALIEHITTSHNIFSIRRMLSNLKEAEYKIFKKNAKPKLIITDYSKAMIQAVLMELSGETLEAYLKRSYRIVFNKCQPDDFDRMFIHICSYHVLKINYENIKKEFPGKECTSVVHFGQRFFGRLVSCRNIEDAVNLVKHGLTVMTSYTVTNDVTRSLEVISNTVNDFDDIPELQRDGTFLETSEEEESTATNNKDNYKQTNPEWKRYWKEKLVDFEDVLDENSVKKQQKR